MWVGRELWRSSNRFCFLEQDHLPTLEQGSLGFAWKAESIKPRRMEMSQPFWTGKAEVLHVMMYSHEKEGRKYSLYGVKRCSRWDWFCKANPLNKKFYKPEQNPNGLLQKGPYQFTLLLLGYRPVCSEWHMFLMVSHKLVTFGTIYHFEIRIFHYRSSPYNVCLSTSGIRCVLP